MSDGAEGFSKDKVKSRVKNEILNDTLTLITLGGGTLATLWGALFSHYSILIAGVAALFTGIGKLSWTLL